MKKLQKHFLYLFLLSTFFGFSQKKLFSNEVGIYVGPVAIASDYNDFENFYTGNIGYNVGIVHYMNFLCSGNCSAYSYRSYLRDHFKVRNEFIYSRVNLKHYGNVIDEDPISLEDDRYRAMEGQLTTYQLGSSLEFYPWSIRSYESGGSFWLPSIGLGAFYTYYTPNNFSTQGFLQSPDWTPGPYINNINNDSGSTISVMGSASARLRISPAEDLLLQARGQYYLSDWVEGVSLPGSRNDITLSLAIGYIYYLD